MKFQARGRILPRNDEAFYPLLGAVAVLAGLAAAIASMPDDPRPIGAMFRPTLYLALGLLTVPILRIRRSISSALRTEHVLMLALVYWILSDTLQSAYALYRVTYDSVETAMIAIGTMAVGIWAGAAGKGWRPPRIILRTARLSVHSSSLFFAVWVCFFLGMFHFAFSSDFDLAVMIDGLGKSRFAAPWSRGELGDWTAFSDHLTYFGYVLPSLTVLLAHQGGWKQPRAIISAVLSLIMVLFLMQSGGRRILGVVIGAALVSWLLLQKRITMKLIIAALMVLALLLATMQGMLKYRQTGFEATGRGVEVERELSYLHVDDNFLRLSQTTALFPDVFPYVGIQPITYALVRPIPRVLWPEKPTSAGYDLPSLVGVRGASLTHSIVGELYVVGGLFAVFLGGVFFGRLARMWNRILDVPGESGKSLVYGLGVMILFAAMRSMQELVLMSYALLGWLVVARIFLWGKAQRDFFRASYSTLPARRIDYK